MASSSTTRVNASEGEIMTRCYDFFKETSQFPHGSYNEKQLSDYLVEFAKKNDLKVIQDDMYNVVIYKDATPGYEDHETVMLQAHMDMVDEKNKDSNHDFSKDPIEIIEMEDGWIKANGTTLGADDGIGTAYMLAILEDKTLEHPALECVFTVQEEVGLFGAMNLKSEYFKAKNAISLDGGDEKTLLSSAGGRRVEIKIPMGCQPVHTKGLRIMVRGLQGGHSGGSIDKELGNSNKIIGRVLYHLQKEVDIRLVSIEGGSKDNAIPRENDTVIAYEEKDHDQVLAIIKKQEQDIFTLLEFSDAGFKLLVEEETVTQSMSKFNTKQFIRFLYLLPNGLVSKSINIPGLTLTSLNVGVISCNDVSIVIHLSLRSAYNESIDEMTYSIRELCDLFEYSMSTDSSYPGWRYKEVNPLRDTICETYKDMTGKEMEKVAAHGGNECGILESILDNPNIANLGPCMKHVHTPQETLQLESFDRMYDVLVNVLKRL